MVKFLQKATAVFLALILLNAQAYALPFNGMNFSNDASEIINFDEAEVYSEFEEIAELSELLITTDISAEEISDPSVLDNISMEASLPLAVDDEGSTGPPLGIPSFLWGCVLSWVGILLVYLLTDENKDETKKAVWGCVAGAVGYTLFYVLIYGAAFASAASTNGY